jgi:hypothetical protein
MRGNNKSIYKRNIFFYKGAFIIKAPKIVNLMSRVSGTPKNKKLEATVFLPGCVFVSTPQTHQFLTHEVIHARQILDCSILLGILGQIVQMPYLWVFGFLAWWVIYLADFLMLRIFQTHHNAYLLISFEQEAYLGEKKRFNFIIPFQWMLRLFKNFLLFNRRYRVSLLRKLVHIRTNRKQYFYWKQKFNKKTDE